MSETIPSLPQNIDPSFWHEQGECRSQDPDQFFPEVKGVARRKHVNETVERVCAPCPVSSECLAHALRAGEVEIWGGTDGRMRDAAKRHAKALVKSHDKTEETVSDAEADQATEADRGSSSPSGISDARILAFAYQKARELRYQRFGF